MRLLLWLSIFVLAARAADEAAQADEAAETEETAEAEEAKPAPTEEKKSEPVPPAPTTDAEKKTTENGAPAPIGSSPILAGPAGLPIPGFPYNTATIAYPWLVPSKKTTDCKDKDDQCPGWAAIGECAKNPPYMLTSCPVSCAQCGPFASALTNNLFGNFGLAGLTGGTSGLGLNPFLGNTGLNQAALTATGFNQPQLNTGGLNQAALAAAGFSNTAGFPNTGLNAASLLGAGDFSNLALNPYLLSGMYGQYGSQTTAANGADIFGLNAGAAGQSFSPFNMGSHSGTQLFGQAPWGLLIRVRYLAG